MNRKLISWDGENYIFPKVTKMGSIFGYRIDNDGVRVQEASDTYPAKSNPSNLSLPGNKCSCPVLTHLILYRTDPFGHNRITSLVSVISCLRPSLMPGKWVSGTQINLSICGLKASLLEYPVLLYCRRLSIQYWRKYMIVVNSCSNIWKRTQLVQWLLGIRIWTFHFYILWY